MKKNQSQRKIRTSFQTQLFIILLTVLALFVVVEYFIVNYSFRGRYKTQEINEDNNRVSSFVASLNGSENELGEMEKFINQTGAVLVIVNNESGSFELTDSLTNEYYIEIKSGENSYKIKPGTYQTKFEINDLVNGSIRPYSTGYYTFVSLTLNGETIIESGESLQDSIDIQNATVESVVKPQNFNFLYENFSYIKDRLAFISTSLSKFKEVKANESFNSGYYYSDEASSTLYCLYQPKSFESSEFVLVLFSLVKSSSITNTISSYYGYVVLLSIVVSVLVALFISRAFSNPVKQIESEMIKLTDNDYAPSNYNFKNKEMISLQDTLNTIKIDTKNKVESIENQKNDVEKLNNELKNENELRTSFIARLSHELKTPLMIISATTEALADDIIPKDEIKRNYETIIEEVDKTNKIIKDIIGTYKSAKASEMNLKITRFSLNELVNSLLENLLPLAQHKELNVITDIKTQVYMDADKELISQAVSNFITNAFKYTEDKGIVEIKIVSERTSYLFEIKNYGAKILEENLQKIWLPFFRENEGVDKTSTGMGLYVVKEILERHKLEYNVENFDQGVVSWFRIKK